MKIKEKKTWIIILLGIFFLHNGIQFLREDGHRSNLLSFLFNMIIINFLINLKFKIFWIFNIFIFHPYIF